MPRHDRNAFDPALLHLPDGPFDQGLPVDGNKSFGNRIDRPANPNPHPRSENNRVSYHAEKSCRPFVFSTRDSLIVRAILHSRQGRETA